MAGEEEKPVVEKSLKKVYDNNMAEVQTFKEQLKTNVESPAYMNPLEHTSSNGSLAPASDEEKQGEGLGTSPESDDDDLDLPCGAFDLRIKRIAMLDIDLTAKKLSSFSHDAIQPQRLLFALENARRELMQGTTPSPEAGLAAEAAFMSLDTASNSSEVQPSGFDVSLLGSLLLTTLPIYLGNEDSTVEVTKACYPCQSVVTSNPDVLVGSNSTKVPEDWMTWLTGSAKPLCPICQGTGKVVTQPMTDTTKLLPLGHGFYIQRVSQTSDAESTDTYHRGTWTVEDGGSTLCLQRQWTEVRWAGCDTNQEPCNWCIASYPSVEAIRLPASVAAPPAESEAQ